MLPNLRESRHRVKRIGDLFTRPLRTRATVPTWSPPANRSRVARDARAAAREEVDFAASLCQHDVNTILAMHRTLEHGEIREQFRSLTLREVGPGADRLHAYARAFEFVETQDETEHDEPVDLVGLAETKPT